MFRGLRNILSGMLISGYIPALESYRLAQRGSGDKGFDSRPGRFDPIDERLNPWLHGVTIQAKFDAALKLWRARIEVLKHVLRSGGVGCCGQQVLQVLDERGAL